MRGQSCRKVQHFILNQRRERVNEPLIQGPAIDEAPLDLIHLVIGRKAGQMFGQRVDAATRRAARVVRILGESDHPLHAITRGKRDGAIIM